jgi:hypothetical protein
LLLPGLDGMLTFMVYLQRVLPPHLQPSSRCPSIRRCDTKCRLLVLSASPDLDVFRNFIVIDYGSHHQ